MILKPMFGAATESRHRRGPVAFLLALAVLVLGPAKLLAQSQHERPSLELWFFDVGQGDAALMLSDSLRFLVDGGRGTDVVYWLDSLRVDSLDLVVASHPHEDHIAGLAQVLSTRSVRAYMDNDRAPRSGTWRWIRNIAQERGIEQRIPLAGIQRLQYGPVTLTIYPPPPFDLSTNNESIGILVEAGKFKAFLTGDAEQEELQYWLTLGVPRVTILKAAHHGARNGVTPGWIAATNPDAVVISVGRDNAYGHPDPWALRYYGLRGRPIWRTDLHSTVRIRAWPDGRFEVETAAVEILRPAAN